MKTFNAKPGEVERKWLVVDLEGQTVGRAAARVAAILRGKTKPEYTPHVDTGDFVIAINADKVVFTGTKAQKKFYHQHSGYPGGLKTISAEKLLQKRPEQVFQLAVRGMLPKNSLGRSMLKKLKIYKGNEHPHQAQKPESVTL